MNSIMLKLRILFLATLCVWNLGNASAHPYLPLGEGETAHFDYHFKVEKAPKDFGTSSVSGRMIYNSKGWETQGSHRSLRYIINYKDIPYMKNEVVFWRREQDGAVYMGYLGADGKFVETLELPASTDVGSTWEYNDGVSSQRKITAKAQVKLPNGTVLSDCIEVSREPSSNPQLNDVTDQTYYCRNLGSARTLFIKPSPIGTYNTETIRNPPPKID